MSHRRYPHADGASQPARLACRIDNDSLNDRRHQIARWDFLAACQALARLDHPTPGVIEAIKDAARRLDMDTFNRVVEFLDDSIAGG